MSAPENVVPFVDLRTQYRDLQPEIDEALLKAVRRGDYILGEDVREFEREFARFQEVEHCVGVADGTDALHLALLALGIGPGDEVIVPANTYIASVLAISSTGARPVLVDCDPVHYLMDPVAVERALTPRTRALLPVHLYGQPVDLDPLLSLARDRRLAVVEDCAQAHGARHRGHRVGTQGDIGCFSFYPGKNLGAYGDGGAIITRRSDLAERVTLLRNYGQRVKYHHVVKGCNSRLDTVQAAILRVKLRHLERWNALRRAAADRYASELHGLGLQLPSTAGYAEHVWHLYVVETSQRAALQQALDAGRIQHGIHYPVPVHRQEAYRDLGLGPGSFPVAEAAAERLISLPMFPELTGEQQVRVAAACRSALA